MLYWRTTNYDRSRFLVDGTELATAIVPGTLSRYQLCEIRCRGKGGHPDRRIAVRDAATVSDEDVRNGKRPRIAAWFDTVDEAIERIVEVTQISYFDQK